MERLVGNTCDKTQVAVSIMADQPCAFLTRHRRRPVYLLAADALVFKVREAGRVVGVHTLIATGVNAEGLPRDPGHPGHLPRTAGWLAFFRGPGRPRSPGVALVTSDASTLAQAAIGFHPPAAGLAAPQNPLRSQSDWQPPRSPPGRVHPLHSIYERPTPNQLLPNMIGYLDA